MKTRKYHRWTADETRTAQAMRRCGMSYAQIAKAMGLHPSSVYNHTRYEVTNDPAVVREDGLPVDVQVFEPEPPAEQTPTLWELIKSAFHKKG